MHYTPTYSSWINQVERWFGYLTEQLLRREDPSLFDDTGSASASSEEFQRRLADAFESAVTRETVLALPWGAGTGLAREGAEPGAVFCARVADHERPQFRYVPLDPASLEPRIVDGRAEVVAQSLTCLDQADPGRHDAPAELPA